MDYEFLEQKNAKIIDNRLVVIFTDKLRNMPLIRKQNVELEKFEYIGFQNIRKFDNREPKNKTVGFFLKDDKFERVCSKPWQYTERLAQYKQVMSPDVSCYTDMPIDEQWHSTFLNRFAGMCWQKQGLTVIPTVSWSGEQSFGFAFAGIEKGSVVAVSTIGTNYCRNLFMSGFEKMCEAIVPSAVICYCEPYREMYLYANILRVEYEGRKAWREAKYRPAPNQLTLF